MHILPAKPARPTTSIELKKASNSPQSEEGLMACTEARLITAPPLTWERWSKKRGEQINR